MDQLQILPCCTVHSLQHLERIVVELECFRIQHGRGRSVSQMNDYITHSTTTSHTHTCNAFDTCMYRRRSRRLHNVA